jgi:predicted  nucleic acid-binding Zn ribbon protein
MYIHEITIPLNIKPDDDFYHYKELLMSFYRGSGQSLGRIHLEYFSGNTLIALHYAHERNAFARKYNNFYVNRELKNLYDNYDVKPQFRVAGKSFPEYKGACACKSHSFLILYTDFISINSPVQCGDCGFSVPLYKLPVYYDHGYMPILSWESNYQSCDRLQMNCEVGERWAMNQMEFLDSQLTRQGREICSRLEELTGVPVYYYLHNYTRRRGDTKSIPCPGCNKKWHLKERLLDSYDFKCSSCRLISQQSPYA